MSDHLKIIHALHRALQRARPLLIVVSGDIESSAWRRNEAAEAVLVSDPATLAADAAFPDHDFYQEIP